MGKSIETNHRSSYSVLENASKYSTNSFDSGSIHHIDVAEIEIDPFVDQNDNSRDLKSQKSMHDRHIYEQKYITPYLHPGKKPQISANSSPHYGSDLESQDSQNDSIKDDSDSYLLVRRQEQNQKDDKTSTKSLDQSTNDNIILSENENNDNKDVTEKSFFSKLRNKLNKAMSNPKLFFAGVFIAVAIGLGVATGIGAPIIAGVVALGAFCLICYEAVSALKNNSNDEELAKTIENEKWLVSHLVTFNERQKIRKSLDLTEEAMHIDITSIREKKEQEQEQEKLNGIDPSKITTLGKIKHGAKILLAPLMGFAVLSLAIAATVLTGGIAPLVFGGCFAAICIFKGVLEFLDLRDKKQTFLDKNKDIPPEIDNDENDFDEGSMNINIRRIGDTNNDI